MNLLSPFFNVKVPWLATLGKIFSCKSRSIGMGDRREPIPLNCFQVPPVGEIDED
jgi:hypothetical protein